MQRKQSSRQNSFVRPRKPPRLARRYQTASSASGSQQDWNLLNQIIDDILAATGIATIFVDRQMRLLRITHLARQLTGIDEQAQGRRLSDLKIETCGCPALAEHTLRVLGTLQPYECEVNSNDGRWYSLRIRPYRNPKRIPLGAVITFTDITHAHHAQEALRENERFLRESQKVAGIASYITDLSSGIWKCSPEMHAIFGIDENYPHTLAGWAAFLHPDTKGELFDYHLKVERELLRFDYEYKIIRVNDGAVRWVHGLGDLEYEDGRPARRIGTIQDITERKQAEEELSIAAVAFEAQNAIIITNPQGIILRVNNAFCRTTGFTSEEAIGQRPGELLRSERQQADFYQQMWHTLKQKGRWQGEIWNRHKNGQVYPHLLTITAVITVDQGVTHYVGSYSDIGEDKEAEAEIHRLAYYDPLTHLPNRRLLQDRVTQALKSSTSSGLYGAIFFIDLDNFKTLNDTRGHDAGDLLLVEIAQRLRSVVREGDTVSRQGGDEFVVLLENLSRDSKEAAVIAQRLGETLYAAIHKPFMLKGQEYLCKLSIGIRVFNQQDTLEELFKHADLALYQAKNAGRDTLRFFDPSMQAELELRSKLEQELYLALAHKQFVLHYQPQVDAQRRMIGVEALLRWQHPQRGLIFPNDFIPLAEETGWILVIGLWALEHACQQLKIWENHPQTSELQIAVNVSARQFRQSDFVDQVERALQSSGANPARLKLELTESLVLEDVEDTINKMHAIKALGVKFAMDDFGTGYSSLAYLAQLPLDQLKIDRSFVLNLPGPRNDETIARTIITMGQGLSMEVIAEGVETEAQRAFLEAHGCYAYQGYFFSRPLTLQALEAMLAAGRMDTGL